MISEGGRCLFCQVIIKSVTHTLSLFLLSIKNDYLTTLLPNGDLIRHTVMWEGMRTTHKFVIIKDDRLKIMSHESDKTSVRVSPSQAQVESHFHSHSPHEARVT